MKTGGKYQMRFGDLSVADDLRSLPEIPRSDITLLWFDNYYDGPLDGIMSYGGDKYLFKMHNQDAWIYQEPPFDVDDYPEPKYLVIALSNDQLKDEEYWHELFTQKVWNGWDLGKDQRPIWSGHPEKVQRATEESAKEFYEARKARQEPDLSDNLVIGWFVR